MLIKISHARPAKKHSFTGYSIPSGAATLIVAGALLSGCLNKTADQYLADAKTSLNKKDNSAAIIQLKSALQEDPSLTEARFLLGKALLEAGDARGAVIELSKAKESSYAEDELAPSMAQAMVAQGQYQQVIATYGQTHLQSPKAAAELQSILAIAYGDLGQTDQAVSLVKSALASDSSNLRAQLVNIRILANTGALEQAFNSANDLLAKRPKESEAWEIKGDLFLRKGNTDEALKAYREAATLSSKNNAAQIGVMTLLLAKKDLTSATSQLEVLRSTKARPDQILMFSALLALEKGELKKATESSLALLKIAPNDARALHLAGMVAYRRGSLIEADNYLTKAVQAAPTLAKARVLLAQTKLRQGDPTKALSYLQPLLQADSPQLEVFSIAGEAYLQTGDIKRAQESFAAILKRDPKDVRSRVALALLDFEKGHGTEGIAALRALAATDSGSMADLALITTFTTLGDWRQALEAIAKLETKTPGKPDPALMRGTIALKQGDKPLARRHFEAALKIDPLFLPALKNLAAMDAEDGHYDAAKERFRKILASRPGDVNANLALIVISAQAGTSKQETASALESLIKGAPEEISPRIALVELQVQSKDISGAKETALAATSALPENADAWRLLGQVQALSGDANQALIALNTWASLAPKSPEPPMAIAEIYAQQGNRSAQIQQIKRSLSLKPDYLPAQVALFSLAIAKKDFSEARNISDTIQSQRPTESIGRSTAGDLNARQEKWAAAITDYKAALKINPSPDLAAKLHRALMAGGRSGDASAWEEEWTAKHPDDVAFTAYLGNQALVNADYTKAANYYLAILKKKPNDAAATNNLAWALHEAKKPGAQAYAEKAVSLAPDQASFLDTLAAIYADSGQIAKAVSTQKRAVELAPNFAIHRLHLAKYYIAANLKAEARAELAQLAALGDKFTQQAEVNRLMSSL